MRTKAVTSGDIDLLPDDLFEISRYAGVREEVVGHIRNEIHEQVHIAVVAVLRPYNRAEHSDVDNAARTKLSFMSTQLRENSREERHTQNLRERCR